MPWEAKTWWTTNLMPFQWAEGHVSMGGIFCVCQGITFVGQHYLLDGIGNSPRPTPLFVILYLSNPNWSRRDLEPWFAVLISRICLNTSLFLFFSYFACETDWILRTAGPELSSKVRISILSPRVVVALIVVSTAWFKGKRGYCGTKASCGHQALSWSKPYSCQV